LAWKTAGWWGLDRWILPALGTPWRPGLIFRRLSEPARDRRQTEGAFLPNTGEAPDEIPDHD